MSRKLNGKTVASRLLKALERLRSSVFTKIQEEAEQAFGTSEFTTKECCASLEKLYDIILSHLKQPSPPFGGKALQHLMTEKFRSRVSPQLVEKLQIMLKRAIVSSLSKRSPYYKQMCDLVEALIDQSRLRAHEIYLSRTAEELKEASRRTERFAAVTRISTALISADTTEEMAKIIDRELRSLFRFDSSVLCLVRDEGQHFVCYSITLENGEPVSEGDFIPIARSPLLAKLCAQDTFSVHGTPAGADVADDVLLKGKLPASLMSCSLRSHDRCIGMLVLRADDADVFSEEDTASLCEIGRQLAAALHSIRLIEVESRRASELAMISEVSSIVTSELDVRDLLIAVALVIQRTFAYFDVSLFLVDKEAGEVEMTAQAGALGDLFAQGYRQKIGDGMVGWTAQTGEVLVANDIAKEPRFIVASELERATKSELCVPIKVGADVIGVINVESKELGAFDQRDINALQMLSNEIGKAVEHARVASDARQVQKYLNQVMTHLPIAVNSFDLNGTYTHWSAGSERMFGYSADEMVGKQTPAFLLSQEDAFNTFMEQCAQQGSHVVEVRARTRDNREIWIYQAMVNLYDDAGNHIGYTASLQDITSRKEAEEQLVREKQKLSDAFSVMNAAVSIIDRDLRVVWTNKAVSDWFKQDEDLWGRHCYEVYCGRGSVCPSCMASHVFETGAPQHEEHVGTTKDGTRRYFHSTITPIRDGSGKIVQILKLTQDITQQAERMHQLDLLRQFGQILPETLELDRRMFLILTCVTAGPGLGFNRAFLLLVNRDAGQLEGRMAVGPADAQEASRIYFDEEVRRRSLRELLEEYDSFAEKRDHPINQLARSMTFSLNDTTEIPVHVLKTKRPIWVKDADTDQRVTPAILGLLNSNQFVCVPLLAREEAIGVIIADNIYSNHVITEGIVNILRTFAMGAGLALDNAQAYERLEDNYRQLAETRDKLLRSERLAAIGSMAAHVAHEIRNPLVSIGGFAHAIVRQTDPKTECHQSATIIEEEVARLETILANVMNFTRPSRPNKVLAKINEIVQGACDFLKSEFHQKALDVDMKLSQDVPMLMFDPDQMRQVLLNIIKNAIESAPQGGRVGIETAEQRDYVRISIRDNGPGIPFEVLENMFNPFFTTKTDGTGLGLAVSRKVIEDHGGELLVQSTIGQGSTFTALLAKER